MRQAGSAAPVRIIGSSVDKELRDGSHSVYEAGGRQGHKSPGMESDR